MKYRVRVITVISGEVGTNILKRDKDNRRSLPLGQETSLGQKYLMHRLTEPIQIQFISRQRKTLPHTLAGLPVSYLGPSVIYLFSKTLLETITPDQYAAGVVNEALKKSPAPWFWHGAQTSIVRWCDMLLPRTFWVGISFHWGEFYLYVFRMVYFGRCSTLTNLPRTTRFQRNALLLSPTGILSSRMMD